MIALVRSGVAWRLLPVVLAVELFAVLSRGLPWLGEWNWTTDWIDGATMLIAPLAAACTGYDAAWVARGEMRELAFSSPRGGRGLGVPVLATLVVVGGAHLLFVVLGLAGNLVVAAGGVPSLVAVPAALSVLAAACGLGAVLGTLLPALYAAPLAGATVVGYHLASGSGLGPQVLRMGGEAGSLVGLTWSLRVLAAAMIVNLVVLVLPMVAVLPALGPARRRGLVATVLCAVTILAAAGTWKTQGWQRIVVSDAQVSYRCVGHEPEVCLATPTSRKLASLEAAMRPHLDHLRAAGAVLPASFRQAVPGHALGTAAPLYLDGDTQNSPTTSVVEAAGYVLTPAVCPQLTADRPPPEAYFQALGYLHAWLLVQAGLQQPATVPDHALRAWLEGPAEDQQLWVRRTYRRLSECRYAQLALPAG